MTGIPSPQGVRVLGHLPRWTADPLRLLEEGATLGPVFDLKLWRRVTVGFTPEWNRAVLGDLDLFRSRGSLSQLSPYLSAGVVSQDNPGHRRRRAELNPSFHRRAVTTAFGTDFDDLVQAALPSGEFEAEEWASAMVLTMLTRAFFGQSFPRKVFESYVAPLDAPMPAPLLRRPVRIRRMNAALRTAFSDPEKGSLAELFATLPDGVQEARVVIAAAYDTTAHTLSRALWELAARPELNAAEHTTRVVEETLRLHPSGWIGSRICTRETAIAGTVVPAGRMVLYSPYLTHRSESLWTDADQFRPQRFDDPTPAWGYIPFAAGERTCLGAGLATLMLRSAVSAFAGAGLSRVSGDGGVRAGLTLGPVGPLRLRRESR